MGADARAGDGLMKKARKPARRLDDAHLAELRASGLTPETIKAAGIYSAADGEITEIVGWKPGTHHWGRGYVIPFSDGYARVKLDSPRAGRDGRVIKYEAPKGAPNRAYFPPGMLERIAAANEIIITEGEKKALAGAQAEFVTIGLSGVWNWQQKRLRDDLGRPFGERKLIPDLAAISWKGKLVFITFDSDMGHKPDVQLACIRLAEVLKEKGAEVLIVALPQVGDEKVGLDDFLVLHGESGPAELRKLLEQAEPPELPEAWGPMEFAKALVDTEFRVPEGQTLRWWRDEFWKYMDRRWKCISENELEANVLNWLDVRTRATPHLASNVAKCLRAQVSTTFDADMPRFLCDSPVSDPKALIPARNGLLNIKTLSGGIEIIDHTPLWFSSTVLDYDFDPNAKCPKWLSFLDQVFSDDRDRIALLQEFFGYLLTPDTSQQKLLLMVGPKRAGKGTVTRVMQHIFGPGNCTSPTLGSLSGDFGLWPLLGRSVAIVPDAHLSHKADSVRVLEIIKSIVGEDAQNVNRKNLPILLNVRLPTRFVITCNELPNLKDASGAFMSRVLLLHFDQTFEGREDRQLGERLRREASGILNWSICGLRSLREEGRFREPKSSTSILADYHRLSSPIRAFFEDCCLEEQGQSVRCEYVYAAWCQWAKSNGHHAGANSTFGEKLRAAFPDFKRRRLSDGNGGRPYAYCGMRLNELGASMAKEWQASWQS
jgi:putative DNA primase/helicase